MAGRRDGEGWGPRRNLNWTRSAEATSRGTRPRYGGTRRFPWSRSYSNAPGRCSAVGLGWRGGKRFVLDLAQCVGDDFFLGHLCALLEGGLVSVFAEGFAGSRSAFLALVEQGDEAEQGPADRL